MPIAESEKDRANGETTPEKADSIDALDILLALSSRKRFIGVFTLITTLIGVAIALIEQPYYTATAMIMPPQQQSSASGLMGQLGSLVSLGGSGSSSFGSSLGMKSQADMYVGILESRTIADGLIAKFNLQ